MATITVKGIPDPLYKMLKERAALERRSINSEVIVCLERALLVSKRDPEELLKKIRQVRNNVKVPYLTEEFLRRAKTEGRQ